MGHGGGGAGHTARQGASSGDSSPNPEPNPTPNSKSDPNPSLNSTPSHHPDPDPNPNQVPRQETLKLLKCAYGVGQQMAVAYYERGVRSLEQVVPTLTRTLTPSLTLTLPHL